MTSFSLFPGDLYGCCRPGNMRATFYSVLLLWAISSAQAARKYFGAEIGNLTTFAHEVRGQVFAVDDDTIFVRGFHYDGSAPDAFFWVGNGNRPSTSGSEIPYPAKTRRPLNRRFSGEDVILHLPEGIKVSTIDYLSVWCRAFTADFGHVILRQDLNIPKPQTIGGFATRRNGVRSVSVVVEDDRTVNVPSFSYDGRGEDAFFIAGKGNTPSMTGDFIMLPDENGRSTPLREYRSENIKLKFPPNRSITEFNWISVFSKELDENLGHISLPRSLLVPPSLEEMESNAGRGNSQADADSLTQFTNCVEPFEGSMQVRWKMDRDGQHVIIQMMGKIRNSAGTSSEYMSFGLSPLPNSAKMVGADVVVGFYDATEDRLRVEDYYMSAKSQCDGRGGVCSDTRLGGTNDAKYINGEVRDGVTVITYKRPLAGGDAQYDLPISVDNDVTVIAAIGQLGADDDPRYHGNKRTAERTLRVNFARENQNSCRAPLLNMDEGPTGSGGHGQHGGPHEHDHPVAKNLKPWRPSVISGVEELQARIGPTGGQRGYSAITGRPSWGISWWINGMLIPEIYVERGKTYKFVIEGGDNPDNPAESHPFYITDSPDGGFGQKQKFERERERVFAGVRSVGNGVDVEATGRGRLCKYVETSTQSPDEFETFEEYKKTLKLDCQQGKSAGQLIWTVTSDTPDEVYYQCFTHKNMGWKIHVKNPGFVLDRQGYGSGAQQQLVSWLSIVVVAALMLRYI